ncbi:MAG: hypothetical protein K6T26_02570 [Alicyclobacillus sp.]|nr:hypothetical protein [Alicyclobacillus sp.]
MTDLTTDRGIWRGWHWRLGGLTVAAVLVLQVIAYFAVHYPLEQSLLLAMLMVSYVIIPKAQERRLANAMAGVVVTFVLGLLLQFLLEDTWAKALAQGEWLSLAELNVLNLAVGLSMAYLYLRLTQWSERKRSAAAAQRAAESRPPHTHRRVHRKKKRKRR